jgi:predicted RNase H-like HicB family nuclease
MQFSLAIHKDPESCYGVTVANLPGAFSAGDTLDGAKQNAKEAILFHIECMLDDGEKVTIHTANVDALKADPDFNDAIWDVVDVDLSALGSKSERIAVDPARTLR